jgi:transcription elongation factor Elf1
MDYISLKYINILGIRLRNFKHRNSVFTFSCPLCGDSKKNPHKTRGYIYEKNNHIIYHCHNCGITLSFQNFLKEMDVSLYQEYTLEKFFKNTDKEEDISQKTNIPIFYDTEIFNNLYSIDELSDYSSIKEYVKSRKIPDKYWDKLFYCPYFKEFTNKLIPGKFSDKSLKFDEERLIIPFFNRDKKIFAYSGRLFEKTNNLRYMNIVLDDSIPKIFGIERWKQDSETFVVEGALDSLFLNNCIATAGGNLISVLNNFNKEIFTIIFDNERYSITTKNKMKNAIKNGYKVCVWPKNLKYKDINEMVLEGMNPLDIENIIRDNAFSGLKAELEILEWSKK